MSKRLLLSCALAGAATLVFGQRQIKVTETAGIARDHEPVTIKRGNSVQVVFVTIGANQSKTFRLQDLKATDELKVKTDPKQVGFELENAVYRADLTAYKMNQGWDDSGTLRGLVFKAANVRYERNPNRMHWAPSFQRAGANGYKSIGNWHPVQEHTLSELPGVVTFNRKGWHPDYPEIGLEAEYRFYSHVPYFVFHGVMSVVKPIEMFWLRNQEMTMDDLFTNLAWPGKDGNPIVTDFEARRPLLKESPMPVDVPWVAFFNKDKGYGFGAVVLKYSSTKEVNPMTSINDGANNGRYWDRRIINQKNTMLTPGDRFEEETAYVVFRTLDEFLLWEKRLHNPLQVEVAGGK